jgi:hypothetical protein
VAINTPSKVDALNLVYLYVYRGIIHNISFLSIILLIISILLLIYSRFCLVFLELAVVSDNFVRTMSNTIPRYNPVMLSHQQQDIDYLAVGHITRDLLPDGERLGGSVAYSALTAKAFGLKPGILTAWAEDLALGPLEGIPIINIGAEQSTTFENIYTTEGRQQKVSQLAPALDFHQVPEHWRTTPIVHLAPVLGEVSPRMLGHFKESTLALTPQGWIRELRADGRVMKGHWPEAEFVLSQADMAVVSQEDLPKNSTIVDRLAANSNLLAITKSQQGCEIYLDGVVHSFEAPGSKEIDSTGAGDIFASAFFIRSHFGDNFSTAARVANRVAAQSVERQGLASTPSPDEILDLMHEAL